MTTPEDHRHAAAGSRPDGDGTWLGWDENPDGAEQRRDAGDALGESAQPTDSGPWLRHDLPDATEQPSLEDRAAAAATAPDSPWLPAETEVEAESRPATSEAATSGAATSGAATSGAAAPPPTSGQGRRGSDAPTPGGLHVLGAAVKEFAIVVGMALVLSFIVKTWLLQAFYIPSGSMENTLQVNDRVIVSKLTPGPVDLKRGDIIVFADPGDWVEPPVLQERGKVVTIVRDTLTFVGLLPDTAENHLIKRIIGLPGDRVVCCDEGGRITVNGEPVKEPYIHEGDAASERDFDVTVPRGRVWVMGDHRSDSSDSRFHDSPDDDGSRGSVDERLIVGRAVALVWPLDHLAWLSNPTDTFARVPAPSGADPATDQEAPTPDGTVTPGGGGGGEVPGGDSTPTVGMGLPVTSREHGGD